MHEVGEDADLAMIDVMVGEGQGDGVEVVQDGGVVFHVGKADEGLPDVGVGKVGAAGAEEAAAAIVVVDVYKRQIHHTGPIKCLM